MKVITQIQKEARAGYEKARPKQFGNLHERMKFVMKALEDARGWKTSEPDPEFDDLYNDLVHGIFDLETEVKYYVAQKPPFGSRVERRRIRKPPQ